DVNAQYECALADNADEISVERRLLDRAALLGEVACPVRADSAREFGGVLQRAARLAIDQLRDFPGLGEHDRAGPDTQQLGEERRGLGVGAPPMRTGLIDEGRIPQGKPPGAAG